MATVIAKGKKFYVVYDYYNESGKKKQKWESGFATEAAAEERRLEIELQQAKNEFILPSDITLGDYLLNRWVPIYSKSHWGLKMYTSSIGLIQNHIIPHLGDEPLQKLRTVDFIQLFQKLSITEKGTYKQGVRVKPEKPADFDVNMDVALHPDKYLSSSTISEVYDILNPALNCAVEWSLLKKNPLPKDAPEKKSSKREIWDDDTMKEALSQISDPLLHLGVHLSFVCSLRNGETVGITLNQIHLKKQSIEIENTLERVYFSALRAVPQKDIVRIFPNKFPNKKSCLVLKAPKTDGSVRTALLTEPLAIEIAERINQIEQDKKRLGEEYHDYNLLFCLENGDPIEPQLMMKWFDKWQKKMGYVYPRLVFHGIRHSATTYKLAISDGDAKSVQGEGGWSSIEMLEAYSRVEMKRRKKLSKKLQDDFYGTSEPRSESEESSAFSQEDIKRLFSQMLQDPEMKQIALQTLFASLAQNNNA